MIEMHSFCASQFIFWIYTDFEYCTLFFMHNVIKYFDFILEVSYER